MEIDDQDQIAIRAEFEEFGAVFQFELSTASKRMIAEDSNGKESQDTDDQAEDERVAARDVDGQEADPDEPAEHDAPDKG